MKKKLVAALLALTLVGAACGGDDGGIFDDATPTTEASRGDGSVDIDDADLDDVSIRPLRAIADEEPVANDADTVMIAAAIDVGAFWEATYPEVYGEELAPLQGGFWSYGPTTPDTELPECGGVMRYDEIAENAFYCPSEDLIAWDRDALIEPFIDQFGAFTAALVMAHEYGHAIQARTGDFDTLEQVISELQADCFAGAWVAYVVEGNSDVFQATLDELDVAVAGLIMIRDEPGSSPDDPFAHGSGFDRVSAFSDGLFEGAVRCASYGPTPPVVTQQVFKSDADAATGGNLPAAELLPLLYADLEDFYTQTFAQMGGQWSAIDDIVLFDPSEVVTCGEIELEPDEAAYASFYCVDDNVVFVDGVNLVPELEGIGDFALASEVARQWAFAAQVQMGYLDNTVETSLHADCLTGLYAGDVFFQLRPDTAQLELSPGDLDEAIISFLAYGTGEGTGSPFERSDAFRVGFLGTETDCEAFLG